MQTKERKYDVLSEHGLAVITGKMPCTIVDTGHTSGGLLHGYTGALFWGSDPIACWKPPRTAAEGAYPGKKYASYVFQERMRGIRTSPSP